MTRLGARWLVVAALWSVALAGCVQDGEPVGAQEPEADAGGVVAPKDSGTDRSPDAGEGEDVLPEGAEARVKATFNLGSMELRAFQETVRCASIALDNDEPLYVEKVSMANGGAFHHSNWYVVPESSFEGPDGFWRCSERNYDAVQAASNGIVLFAQSTQALYEEQKLDDGVVIKIPPRSRIISEVHLLNLSSEPAETQLRLQLEFLHPRLVEEVVTPMFLDYRKLEIQPQTETQFSATCDLARAAGGSLEGVEVRYLLPHYHYLGNLFDVQIVGGERDGESIFRLEGFNGEPNGQKMDPPVDLSGATGLRFTCGYNNPTNEVVGFGIGDQEMCMMLGFLSSPRIFVAQVNEHERVGDEPGLVRYEGLCAPVALGRRAKQHGMPTEEEMDHPIALPPTIEPDDGPLLEPCRDQPADAQPSMEPTLETLHQDIFTPSCTYSSCHGAQNPQAGLDLLTREGLGARLRAHAVKADTEMPLVDPGNPANSWIYELVSRCEPTDASGQVVAHMPLNAPQLLRPEVVALLRDWIAAGATGE